MILLLNIARFLMVLWIAYGLLLIFAPSVVHAAQLGAAAWVSGTLVEPLTGRWRPLLTAPVATE
jgi:hypothetical protein